MSILELLRIVLASFVGSFLGLSVATIILTKHEEKKKKKKNFAKINGNSNNKEFISWVLNFEKFAENSYTPKLQDLWARILAGQIAAKTNTSVRTMSKVSLLSETEATFILEVVKNNEFDLEKKAQVLTEFLWKLEFSDENIAELFSVIFYFEKKES